jgi:hypothetical protein
MRLLAVLVLLWPPLGRKRPTSLRVLSRFVSYIPLSTYGLLLIIDAALKNARVTKPRKRAIPKIKTELLMEESMLFDDSVNIAAEEEFDEV